VPFLHQGRSRLGVDCIGYVACVLEALQVLPPGAEKGLPKYAREPGPGLEQAMERLFVRCPRESAHLILIRWPYAKYPAHSAVCTGPTLIHCYATLGRVLEHGYREPWQSQTASAWRVPGVL
jgi:hypothetical protein